MINIEKVLIDLGVEYRSGGQDNFKIRCINPDHIDTNPSMYMHKESGILHCFSCSQTGNIFSLLKHFEIYGVDAILYLQKFAKDGHTAEEIRKSLEIYITSRKKDNEEETVVYDNIEVPPHHLIESNFYLHKRGITPEEMKEWNMAEVDSGKYVGWILIPLYQEGVLRNYFMRSSFGSGKIYGKYARHNLLAGLDFCKDYNKPIYVTEGIFDAISVKRAGVQAVACLSNRLLKDQLALLKRYNEVIIVPDNDTAGTMLVESAGPLLHNMALFVCALPFNRKDAAECTTEEIISSLSTKIMWSDFLINKKFFTKIS